MPGKARYIYETQPSFHITIQPLSILLLTYIQRYRCGSSSDDVGVYIEHTRDFLVGGHRHGMEMLRKGRTKSINPSGWRLFFLAKSLPGLGQRTFRMSAQSEGHFAPKSKYLPLAYTHRNVIQITPQYLLHPRRHLMFFF